MNQSGQNQPTTFRSPSSKKSIYKLSTPSWDATKSAWLRLRGIFVPSDNYVLNSFDDDDDDEDSSIVNLRDMAHRSPYSPWSFASNYSYWALRVKLEESRLKKYSANRTRQHRSGRWYSSQNNLQDNMFSLKESQYKYGKISYGALYIGNFVWSSLLFVGATVVNLAIGVMGIPLTAVAVLVDVSKATLGEAGTALFSKKRGEFNSSSPGFGLLDEPEDDGQDLFIEHTNPSRGSRGVTIYDVIKGLSNEQYSKRFPGESIGLPGLNTVSIQSLLAMIDLASGPHQQGGNPQNKIGLDTIIQEIRSVLVRMGPQFLDANSEVSHRGSVRTSRLAERDVDRLKAILSSEYDEYDEYYEYDEYNKKSCDKLREFFQEDLAPKRKLSRFEI